MVSCDCCKDVKPKTSAIILLVILSLIFISFIISIIFMPSSTGQYKESVENLEQIINDTIWDKFPKDCFKDEYEVQRNNYYGFGNYCFKDGEKYEAHKYKSEFILESFYKSFRKIELSFNIIRIIIVFLNILDLLFILIKYLIKINESNDGPKLTEYLKIHIIIMIVLSVIIITISSVLIILKRLADINFSEIGLYKVSLNEFINCLIINYYIDAITDVLLIVSILFLLLIQKNSYKQIVQQPIIYTDFVQNYPPQNIEENQEEYKESPENNSRRASNTNEQVKIYQQKEQKVQPDPKIQPN